MQTYEEALQGARNFQEKVEHALAMRKVHGEENGFLAGRLRERLAEAQARLAALETQGEAAYNEEQNCLEREAAQKLTRNQVRHDALWEGMISHQQFFEEVEG